jgi:hypothetical protein
VSLNDINVHSMGMHSVVMYFLCVHSIVSSMGMKKHDASFVAEKLYLRPIYFENGEIDSK